MTTLRQKSAIALVSGALLLGVGGWTMLGAQTAPPVNPGGPVNPGEHEKHPALRHALREMRAAKKHLEEANHDFGGHRVEAIKALDEAIKQIEVALQFDKE
jgi:hypothetical protein